MEEFITKRIKDCKSARDVYQKYKTANRLREFQMQQVRNQMEGGRPHDPEVLAKNGESWRTNVNFRDAEASFDRTYIPYWQMVNDVPNRISVTCHTNSPKREVINKAIAECFDLFLEDWGADYQMQFMMSTEETVKFGAGYVMYSKEDSPRYSSVGAEQVLLPRRAKSNVEKWDIVCLEDEMTIGDFWALIKDKKTERTNKHVGWNPAMIRKAISNAQAAVDGQNRLTDWKEIQDRITSNDLFMSEEWSSVKIVRTFIKNFDGKIACYVFTQDSSTEDFLFENDAFSNSMASVINGIFYKPGVRGLVHTVKGFGIKNYYFSVLQNRTKSRLFDAVNFAAGMNFQRTDESPSESPPVENYGAINIFPRGITQLPNYANLANIKLVINQIDQNADQNNYVYRDSTNQIAETNTAKQAEILASLSEKIGSASASIFLAQQARIFDECFKRLIQESDDPDAKLFIERLKERGVTTEVIKLIRGGKIRVIVKTGASPGTAGTALRDAIFKELLGLSNMPGMNKTAILQAYLANKLGSQAIQQFMLPEGQDSMPAQRREAMIENSNFGQGLPLPVDPNDAHFEHSDEHLKPLEAIVAAYHQRGQLQQEHLIALQITLPHVQQHVQFLQQDETMVPQYKNVWARLSNVQSVTSGIIKKLQNQQKQQAMASQAQGADPSSLN